MGQSGHSFKNISRTIIGLGLLSGILFSGCGNRRTLQDAEDRQNAGFTKARRQALTPAQGTYKGKLTLDSSERTYDMVVDIKITTEVTRVASSQDQTETVEVPKLTGALRFPVLDIATERDLPRFAELTQPMGGFMKVLFSEGNFSPNTTSLILDYTVPGYSGDTLGELEGTLSDGHFSGIWYSKPFGNIGTFDLILQQPTAKMSKKKRKNRKNG